MPNAPDRWVCTECEHVCTSAEMLRAPHPFQSPSCIRSGEIVGCPKCREAETMTRACDVEGCGREASLFTPGRGFRCHGHRNTEVPDA